MTPEQKRDFRALVAAIAKALGGTVTRAPDPDDNYWNAKLTTGAALPLWMSYRSHEKKITVSLDLPPINDRDGGPRHQSWSDVITYEEQKGAAPTYEIGVSFERGADAIARDITRRLIPGATILYTRALARKATAEEHARGTAATIANLSKQLNTEPRGVRLYCGGCTLEVSGPDSVRFDHLYVTAELAAKIAALVMAEKGDE